MQNASLMREQARPYWPIYPPGILIQSLVPNGIFVCVKLVFYTADILLGSAVELLYLLIILFLWWRSGIRHSRCVLSIPNILLVYILAAQSARLLPLIQLLLELRLRWNGLFWILLLLDYCLGEVFLGVLLGHAGAVVVTLVSHWHKLLVTHLGLLRGHVTSRFSLLGLILLIEESEVIWVFLLFAGHFFSIHLEQLVLRGLLILIGWSLLMVTDAVVAVVSAEHTIAWMAIRTDVVWVLVTTVP
jgi:hypothetical protein